MSDCCSGNECGCAGDGVTLVYACSGGCDLGEIADRAARRIASLGCGKFSCLASIGAGVSGYVQSAKGADRNIVIDGCAVGCGGGIFKLAGIPCEQIVLSDTGMKKGRSGVSDETIAKAEDYIRGKMNNGAGNGK